MTMFEVLDIILESGDQVAFEKLPGKSIYLVSRKQDGITIASIRISAEGVKTARSGADEVMGRMILSGIASDFEKKAGGYHA